jgi:hypothetical protein
LVLRGIDLGQVVDALQAASPLFLALTVVSYGASVWAKAQRWRLLFFPRHTEMPRTRFVSLTLIGAMANIWLFARSGELVRAYLLDEFEDIGKALALGTIVVERSLESVLLLASLVLLAFLTRLPSWLQMTSIALAMAMAGFLLLLVVAAQYPKRLIGWGERLTIRFPWLSRWRLSERATAAAGSLALFRHREVCLRLLGWSTLAWLVAALTNQFSLWTVDIAVPWYAPLFLQVVFYVGAVIPASPGRLGVFHYIAVRSLALFDVTSHRALSFAIVLHLVAYVLVGIAGAICLWRESYALQRCRERGAQPMIAEGKE